MYVYKQYDIHMFVKLAWRQAYRIQVDNDNLEKGRLIYVHRWSLGSRGCAENQAITNKSAENQPITNESTENYQQITNELSLGTRGIAENISL